MNMWVSAILVITFGGLIYWIAKSIRNNLTYVDESKVSTLPVAMVTGIVSGFAVIVIDRGWEIIKNSAEPIVTSNWKSVFYSFISSALNALWQLSLISFLVLYLFWLVVKAAPKHS